MFRALTNEEKATKLLNDEVIVRVWPSEHNIRKVGINRGCVSLELTGKNKLYISFNKTSAEAFSNQIKDNYNDSLEQDIKSLGREPAYTYKFYTLDQQAIIDKKKELDSDKSKKYEPKESANYVWLLLKAANIKNNIPKTSEVIGNLEEASKGKLHKFKGEAVVAEKAIGALAKVPSLFGRPEISMAVKGVAVCSEILKKNADKKFQEHPFEEIVHGATYSISHIFQKYKNADNIIKQLQIAEENELNKLAQEFNIEKEKFIKMFNEFIQKHQEVNNNNVNLSK